MGLGVINFSRIYYHQLVNHSQHYLFYLLLLIHQIMVPGTTGGKSFILGQNHQYIHRLSFHHKILKGVKLARRF